jgi:DNA-binding GntR family transcriptional regulator
MRLVEKLSTKDDGPEAATLPERIFTEIRRAIVEGEIAAGSKISEPDLARRFGISRAPLREAIGRLEACSLVVRRPNFGARVTALSAQGLLELYDMREALEGLAARSAAERMTTEEIAGLRALLDEHERSAELRGGTAYVQQEGDLDFHYRLVQGSHNDRLVVFLCDDLYHLVRMYRYQLGMTSPRVRTAFREHVHLVEAIESRDAELAELLMRRHIRAARGSIERQLVGKPEAHDARA